MTSAWTTFRSSTLAMSVGIPGDVCWNTWRCLLEYYVFSSIKALWVINGLSIAKMITGNMIGLVHAFFWLAIFCFAFFTMVVFAFALMDKPNFGDIAPIKHTLDRVIFIDALFPVTLSIVVQRTFRLRAML